MTPVLLVPPASEPVSLADAKAWLRLDTNDEDPLVSALITSARMVVEAKARRVLVTQTWRLTLDTWPGHATSRLFGGASLGAAPLSIPLAPVASIVALRVYDAGDVPQTIDSATYRLAGAPDDARLVFASPTPPPGRVAAGIEMDVVAGYGGQNDVPSPLRQAMFLLIARWFENRGDARVREAGGVPISVAAIIAAFCRLRLA